MPNALRTYLEMIKIEHSVFALPFALIGMMWASLARFESPWPGIRIFVLILVAMVSARAAAMTFNRIVDRQFDALNERTKGRAIPSGLLSIGQVWFYLLLSVGVFVFAAAMLNPLALALSPVALIVTLGYSFTKRFTALSHFVLGVSLGIAPAAAWIAVTGSFDPRALWLVGAVAVWVTGFDILYAIQDIEFDRVEGLRSIPASVGIRRALWVSRTCHALAVALLVAAALALGGPISVAGAVLCGALLAYEQWLVRPDDLSKLNAAFFAMNGYVAILMFVSVWLEAVLR